MSSEIIVHEDGTRELRVILTPIEQERLVFDLGDDFDSFTELSISLANTGKCFLRDTYEMIRRDLGHPRRTRTAE